VIEVREIRMALIKNQPTVVSASRNKQAAVALIVNINSGCSRRDPEIVFIERAFRAGDPWSGQMAFPGGRRTREDQNLSETACRETQEEVGVDLSSAKKLGRLDDLTGRHSGQSKEMVISCFVFLTHGIDGFFPNREVADVITSPLSSLLDPNHQTRVAAWTKTDKLFPGIRLDRGERIIWGLTYRFLLRFFSLFGYYLPQD